MPEWDPKETARRYRRLAAAARQRAAELLVDGADNELTKEAVASLLRDAKDNEEIAEMFDPVRSNPS